METCKVSYTFQWMYMYITIVVPLGRPEATSLLSHPASDPSSVTYFINNPFIRAVTVFVAYMNCKSNDFVH